MWLEQERVPCFYKWLLRSCWRIGSLFICQKVIANLDTHSSFEVKSLVNGSRPYHYSASEGTYLQPTAAAHILALALKFNKPGLSKVSIATKPYGPLEIPLGENIKIGPHSYSADSNLGQVVALGSKDLNVAHQCLDKFIQVISQQTA